MQCDTQLVIISALRITVLSFNIISMLLQYNIIFYNILITFMA